MGDLKPCPFCGTCDVEVRIANEHPFVDARKIVCNNCGGRSGVGVCERDVISAWNRRATPTTPAQPERGGDEPTVSAPMTREEIRTAAANRIAARKAPDAAEVARQAISLLWEHVPGIAPRIEELEAMISIAEQEGRA